MGMVAWSGDPALQEMAGHITLFYRLQQSQSPRNDANIVPYKSFAAFVTIGKIFTPAG